jgi:putative transposase
MRRTSTPDFYRTREEIEQIVILQRLHLYNKGLPCGAKAIQNLLFEQCVLPLPSLSTIKRILSRNCLTYRRTGYYPEDENGEHK